MMEILDPTTEAATQTIAYVPRPTALQGKRVALIENTKYNSDRLLEKIGDILKAEYGVAEWRMYRKHNASVPAHAEIIEEVKKSADVMVAGIGD
jgi:flavorubredoxin